MEFNLGNKEGVGMKRRSQLQCEWPSNRSITTADKGRPRSLQPSSMSVEEHKNRANTQWYSCINTCIWSSLWLKDLLNRELLSTRKKCVRRNKQTQRDSWVLATGNPHQLKEKAHHVSVPSQASWNTYTQHLGTKGLFLWPTLPMPFMKRHCHS